MTPDPRHAVLSALLDALRTYRTLTFVLADDLGERCGITNLDAGTVFLHADNDDGEMAATIQHELLHLTCPECPEEEIEYLAAERLVPLGDALSAAASGEWAATAAALGVDVQLLKARLRDPRVIDSGDGVG